jgi:6-phosphogluconolactonase (cycloisomerase 2 family)
VLLSLLAPLLLQACGGGGGGGGSGPLPQGPYVIAGTVGGLASGEAVTLLDNGADPLRLSSNGAFRFATEVPRGGSYNVTVGSQPAGQVCSVTFGSGAGVTADVRNVSVTCSSSTYAVGGTLGGLAAGRQLTLLDNGGDPLVLTANGSFRFASPVAYGSRYLVTVGSQPTGQVCSIGNATGTGTAGDVSNVGVVCSSASYALGGTLTGLAAGEQVTLLDNGGNPLTVTANGSFQFPTGVAYGGSYAVTVGTQPVTQRCTVGNASGSAVSADVTSLNVVCSAHSVYAANMQSNSLSQFTMGSTGMLAAMSPASVGTGTAPEGMAVDPGGRYAYAVNTNDSTISQYAIDSAGALGAMSPAAVTTGSSPYGVVVDPTGHFVYATNNMANTVSQYTIGSNGALVPMAQPTVAAGSGPYSVAVDPTGHYAYVVNNGNSTLSQYVLGAGGALSPLTPSSVSTGAMPIDVAVDPTGHYVYVSNTMDNTLSQYSVGGGGALVPMSPATLGTGQTPEGIVVDPSGRYVYVANYADNTLSQYTVGSTGALTPMNPPTVATGTGPRYLAVAPSGRFLYVSNYTSGTVWQYAIGSGGALTPLATSAIGAGSGTWGIAAR